MRKRIKDKFVFMSRIFIAAIAFDVAYFLFWQVLGNKTQTGEINLNW